MNKITHPIEPEELMAYLDGELDAEREAVAVAHMKDCEECRSLASDLRGVSQSLRAWDPRQPEVPLSPATESALNEIEPQLRKVVRAPGGWRGWFPRLSPNLEWIGGLAIVVIVVVGTVRMIGGNAHNVFSMVASSMPEPQPASQSATPSADKQYDRLEQFAKLEKAPAVAGAGGNRDSLKEDRGSMSTALVPSGPMIIRIAQLSLITKDFDNARESVEAILKRHRGYIGELKVGGSTGSGRNLTGTLRIPADQLDATIADLKPLGRVETETQSGQDVTSQYVDLQARLTNARNTEQRLTDLLRNRTGKLSDVLEVEQELDRVRGEIEQMEAERKNMANQVSYATLNLTVTEDYKAELQVVPPSTSTRLSNAAVEGYRSVVDGILSATLFLLSTGPTLLLWGLILFFPARLLWRKARGLAH